MSFFKFLSIIVLTTAIISFSGCNPSTEVKEINNNSKNSYKTEKFESLRKLAEKGNPGKALDNINSISPKNDYEKLYLTILKSSFLQQLNRFKKSSSIFNDFKFKDEVLESIRNLFYAQSLIQYFNAYSYEIQSRSNVSGDKQDINSWSTMKIKNEIETSFIKAASLSTKNSKMNIEDLDMLFSSNEYPWNIRQSLLETISYKWINFYQNTMFWTPKEHNEVYQLSPKNLVNIKVYDSSLILNKSVHPLEKISLIIKRVKNFGKEIKNNSIELEAINYHISILSQHLAKENDLIFYKKYLKNAFSKFSENPWLSMIFYNMANIELKTNSKDSKLKAYNWYKKIIESYPKSIAANKSKKMVFSIEEKRFNLTAMKLDNIGKKSIDVEYKNIKKLYFKAYKIDVIKSIKLNKEIYLKRSNLTSILNSPSDYSWEESLPETKNFRLNKLSIIPQIDKYGYYNILISNNPDFNKKNIKLELISLNLSKNIISIKKMKKGKLIVHLTDGHSGNAINNARIDFYKQSSQKSKKISSKKTSQSGKTSIIFTKKSNHSNYIITATEANKVTFHKFYYYQATKRTDNKKIKSIIYTDRSLYSPGEMLYWKSINYVPSLKLAKNKKISVKLLDYNNKVIYETSKATSKYGSIDGKIKIPTNRLLGNWKLKIGNNTKYIQVEKYKRPSFKIIIDKSNSKLALNRKSEITGKVKNYSGDNLLNSKIHWVVKRMPIYPFWWFKTFSTPQADSQVISEGSTTSKDGLFKIPFTPKVDSDKIKKTPELCYSYEIQITGTSPNGETISTSKYFNIGAHDYRLQVDFNRNFYVSGDRIRVSAKLVDLNNNPKSKTAKWQVLRIKSDIDNIKAEINRVDRKYQGYKGQLRKFKESGVVKSGKIKFNKKGLTKIPTFRLSNGEYRLRIMLTGDSSYETSANFLVTSAEDKSKVDLVLLSKVKSYKHGNTASILIGSKYKNQNIFYNIYNNDGDTLYSKKINLQSDYNHKFKIKKSYKGQLTLEAFFFKDYQLISQTFKIDISNPKNKLKIKFGNFNKRINIESSEKVVIPFQIKFPKKRKKSNIEMLAYMYDKSLDAIIQHNSTDLLSIYRVDNSYLPPIVSSLGKSYSRSLKYEKSRPYYNQNLKVTNLKFLDSSPISYQRQGMAVEKEMMFSKKSESPQMMAKGISTDKISAGKKGRSQVSKNIIRKNNTPLAFWKPNIKINKNGKGTISFNTPKHLSEWKLNIHALSQNFEVVDASKQLQTYKSLVITPNIPLFAREKDQIFLKYLIKNNTNKNIEGIFKLSITDKLTNRQITREFKIASSEIKINIKPKKHYTIKFPVKTPKNTRDALIKSVFISDNFSDGVENELKIIPLQETITENKTIILDKKEKNGKISFTSLTQKNGNISNADHIKSLTLRVDTNLITSILDSMEYINSYKYESSDVIANKISSILKITTLFENSENLIPIRKQLINKYLSQKHNNNKFDNTTPWAKSSNENNENINFIGKILDQKESDKIVLTLIKKLKQYKNTDGGISWWPGGNSSLFTTLNVLDALSEIDTEKYKLQKLIDNAVKFVSQKYKERKKHDYQFSTESLTYILYIFDKYDVDDNGIDTKKIEKNIDKNIEHLSNYSLTIYAKYLDSISNSSKARNIIDKLFDSAVVDKTGTHWIQEGKTWVWYNDSVYSHALIFDTLIQILPSSKHTRGLYRWLMLNKKLNSWKSFQASVNALSSLVKYFKFNDDDLISNNSITIASNKYIKKIDISKDQISDYSKTIKVIKNNLNDINLENIAISQTSNKTTSVSAVLSYETSEIINGSSNDLLDIEKQVYKVVYKNNEKELVPLNNKMELGDEIEVLLKVKSKHKMSYIHIEDPLAAAFERKDKTSRSKYENGLIFYQENDIGKTNFFFENLPAGEYTFKYNAYVTSKGSFYMGPSKIQNLYSPDISAHTKSSKIKI